MRAKGWYSSYLILENVGVIPHSNDMIIYCLKCFHGFASQSENQANTNTSSSIIICFRSFHALHLTDAITIKFQNLSIKCQKTIEYNLLLTYSKIIIIILLPNTFIFSLENVLILINCFKLILVPKLYIYNILCLFF